MENRPEQIARILNRILPLVGIDEVCAAVGEMLEVPVTRQQVHLAFALTRGNRARYNGYVPYSTKGRHSIYVWRTNGQPQVTVDAIKALTGKRVELGKRLTMIRHLYQQVVDEAEREIVDVEKDFLETERDGLGSQYQLTLRSFRRTLRNELAYWSEGWAVHPNNSAYSYKGQHVILKVDLAKNIVKAHKRYVRVIAA